LAPEVLILMYHRVAELPSDPYELAVTPRHFEEQIEVLRKRFRPIPLRQLAEALRDGSRRRLPRGGVVLTFDDGYADNLDNAKPILEKWEVPATVFVATGYVGKRQEFWWDELQRQVLEPGTLPETFSLDLPGEAFKWRLGDAACYGEDEYQAQRRWPGSPSVEAGPRQHLLVALIDRLRPLPEAEQRRALGQLAEWTGNKEARLSHRPMDVDELRRLEEGGLVEVGAHTMTHPMLSAHPAEVQRHEVLRSRAGLEEVLGHPVADFAYPFGAPEHYNDDTVAILREGGLRSAVTTTPGLAGRGVDRYRLPRHVVRDWDGDTFARNLEQFFKG
jgi:peptidoglycan/xylan/chitin deacetylase (PgdA/CDA1 family)